MLYAVVDIETTGGSPKMGGITEVCVCITDGEQILSEYETLINTGYSIPKNITALTGITNDMCENAPVFETIAGELYHLLHDKIFVAHNVNFDYSFLQFAFAAHGFRFMPERLCSAKLARKAFPGYRSYGLGSICKHLNIEIENRHRAGGDARATTVLFHRAIATIGHHEALTLSIGKRKQVNLPANITLEAIEKLPDTPGIYYFRDKNAKPLYIGKAKELQKRVLQHFEPKTGKLRLALDQVYSIDIEESGSESLALFMESTAIMQYWPAWNVAAKNPFRQYAIHCYPTSGGALRMQTEKRNSTTPVHNVFSRLQDARAAMFKLIYDFEICTGLAHSSTGCGLETCYCKLEKGAQTAIHNKRVLEAMHKHQDAVTAEYIFIGNGRTEAEKAVLGMRNGCVYGWGFWQTDSQDAPETVIQTIKENPELRKLSAAFMRNMQAGKTDGFVLYNRETKPEKGTKKTKLKKSTSI